MPALLPPGEDDHRRLKSLRAVHRHHPDGICGRRRVALDLDLASREPGDEAVERSILLLLELQRAAVGGNHQAEQHLDREMLEQGRETVKYIR